eukprot:m.24442 g.24442  ORF g.24442 m.24442 type:complete len:95 (-) comp9681_c0_seq2:167-451(-)
MTHTNRRHALKHSGYDRPTNSGYMLSKKQGYGAFNWGKAGDELEAVPLDKGDPMYEAAEEVTLTQPPRLPAPLSPREPTSPTESDKIRVVSPSE